MDPESSRAESVTNAASQDHIQDNLDFNLKTFEYIFEYKNIQYI